MSFLPDTDTVQYWSGIATLIGIPFSFAALIYAAMQLRLSRRGGSGATLLTLTQAFRENWRAYLEAPNGDPKVFAFADLANLMEASCAIHRDQLLYGHSKKVLEIYLISVFRLLQDNDETRNNLLSLRQTKETFENIQNFMTIHKSAINSDVWQPNN